MFGPNVIPKDRYISRAELMIKTNKSDRAVRKNIESLRNEGNLITMHSPTDEGTGYKTCTCEHEKQVLLQHYKSRIDSLLMTYNAMKDVEVVCIK